MLRRILSTKNKARQLHRMMLGQLLAHDLLHDEKRRIFQSNSLLLAEREGFEPPIPLRVCRISSAVLSTTQPPLRSPKPAKKAANGRRYLPKGVKRNKRDKRQ